MCARSQNLHVFLSCFFASVAFFEQALGILLEFRFMSASVGMHMCIPIQNNWHLVRCACVTSSHVHKEKSQRNEINEKKNRNSEVKFL